MEYTVEVYQADARFKAGEHRINKVDLENVTLEQAQQWGPEHYKHDPGRKYRFEVHETWIVRRNLMTNIQYKERYDTPISCSPASETYWSM